jgi:hypothetical protein
MTLAPFELGWLGGPAERHFRRRRGNADELPWGTLSPRDFPPVLVERARVAWTSGAFSEYCTAAAFAEILAALLAVRAPVDLIGMAGDFVADEMLHVELNARMAMELGGAAPRHADFDDLVALPDASLGALQRASELVVRTCCVGEALSVPMLAATKDAAVHPLTRAVLARIVRDEAHHARFGWLYLEWAAARFDDAERARLARVAKDALAEHLDVFPRREATRDPATEAFAAKDVNALGWMNAGAYAERAQRAMHEDIAAPLAGFGILIVTGGQSFASPRAKMEAT